MQVLSDPVQRMVYDDIHGYSLTATNPFLDDSCRKDHVFVDEFSCIGMHKVTLSPGIVMSASKILLFQAVVDYEKAYRL